jgi:hypothetical protein
MKAWKFYNNVFPQHSTPNPWEIHAIGKSNIVDAISNNHNFHTVNIPEFYCSQQSVFCTWCHTDISKATMITYINGNLPICDFCLMKAGYKPNSPVAPNEIKVPSEHDADKERVGPKLETYPDPMEDESPTFEEGEN